MSKSRDLGEFPAAALDIDASGNLDVTGTVTADGLTVAAGAYGTLLTAGGTNGYISVSNPSDNLVTAFTGTSDVLALGTSNTERMRLDANGAVGINYSNPSALGTVTIKQTADSKGIAIIDSTGTNTFFLENDGTQCNIRNNSASPMVFTTNLAERMRIDSAGVVTLSNTSATDTTAGRVMTVGAFGLGADGVNVTRVTDFDTVTATGFYATEGTATSRPPNASSGRLTHQTWDGSNNYGTQIFQDITSIVRMWMRTKSAGTWSDWVQMYTTANLNTNQFGSGANKYIALGYAQSATSARFFLPISLYNTPSSVTVSGTFFALLGGSSRGDAVITGLASASNKMAVISVEGLSGLTTGQAVSLYATSSDAKITVNA